METFLSQTSYDPMALASSLCTALFLDDQFHVHKQPATFHHFANSVRGMAFPSAIQPALLGCRWSPLSYAGSSCVGWLGSRKTASRSTAPSNSPLLRIQSLTF